MPTPDEKVPDEAVGLTRRRFAKSLIAAATVLAAKAGVAKQSRQLTVASPDGKLVLTLDLTSDLPRWSIARDAMTVIAPSALSLQLASGTSLGASAEFLGISRRKYSGSWTPKFGISATYDETSNELTVHLRDTKTNIAYDIIARVFNIAAAIRQVIVKADNQTRVRLSGEQTEFRFPESAICYASRDEGEILVGKIREDSATPKFSRPMPAWPPVTPHEDSGPLCDYPITVDIGNGLYALMAESDRPHYPRAMLRVLEDNLLGTHLMRYPGRTLGPDGKDVPTPEETGFDLDLGQMTPWRILIVSQTAADLLAQGGVISTLATPCVLDDTSWIKAGRAYRVRGAYTTQNGLAAVDWAAKHKFEYIEYDAHWYGDGSDDSDATVPIAGLDIRKIISYAATHGMHILLYVDRMPAMKQLNAICRTYSEWGVAGIKFGFLWEGRKSDADILYDLIRTCADHRLICDIHDDIRPAGLERTLPNYVALEGVRGNEQFPPARHNVNLAFQRAIVGPMDYTICYAQDRNQTTNAHQLALAVLYYAPQAYLYWYDSWEKYIQKPWPELTWFDDVPVSWDETYAVSGELGEFVVLARRKGARWYLGAITNEQSRRATVSLEFLDRHADAKSITWRAHRYSDGEWNKWVWKTDVIMDELEVTAATVLQIAMNPAGGQAIMFERT
jgi:alpha-glucosidase